MPFINKSIESGLSGYFTELEQEISCGIKIPYSILELVSLLKPGNLALVHYSGFEDQQYYHEAILTGESFSQWTKEILNINQVSTNCLIPVAGEIYKIDV